MFQHAASLDLDVPAYVGVGGDRLGEVHDGIVRGEDHVRVDESTPNARVPLVYAGDPAGADRGYDGIDTNCGQFQAFDGVWAYFAADGGSSGCAVDGLDATRNGIAREPGAMPCRSPDALRRGKRELVASASLY